MNTLSEPLPIPEKNLKGTVRPFGMIKALQEFDLELPCGKQGYLGIAFD
jgi:hypothetical protein